MDVQNVSKPQVFSESNEDSKPLLPSEDTFKKTDSPQHINEHLKINTTEGNDKKNQKSLRIKSVQMATSNEQLDGLKNRGRSIILKKASVWRKKSRQSVQMKNEDRERKATETLAIVLGN